MVITSSKKRKTITSPAPKFILEIDEDIAQTSEINEQEQETNDREVEESDMQSDDYNDLDTNNFLQSECDQIKLLCDNPINCNTTFMFLF